tara:strand:+ start:23348 stop:23716 length:369 start_codon:yes stop_codon:yes gene_type:complete
MELATAKIKSKQPNGQWKTGDGKVFNKFEVVLDNDLVLNKFQLEDIPWKKVEGDTVTYDLEKAQNGTLKEVSNAEYEKEMKILRCGCLKAASTLFTASKNTADAEKVIETSKRFEAYCLTGN